MYLCSASNLRGDGCFLAVPTSGFQTSEKKGEDSDEKKALSSVWEEERMGHHQLSVYCCIAEAFSEETTGPLV